MCRPLLLAAGLAGGIAWAIGATVAAQENPENPMLGAWIAVDPATGMPEILMVTPDHITFGGAAPPIPYRFEPDGDALAVYLADGERPSRFLFLDNANAQLSVPDGPTIALRRPVPVAPSEPAAPATAAPAPSPDAIEAAVNALLPPVAKVPFDPFDPSLEGLLANGWQLDDINGSEEGVTLLMSNGGYHAYCVLLPRKADAADNAAADCRRLN